MNRRIIYLKFTPLTKKVYDDCCMAMLLDAGYTIEYWEISSLVDAHYNIVEKYDPGNQLILREINDIAEFCELVSQNGDSLYVTLMSMNLRQVKLLRKLASYNNKLAFWGPFPTPYERQTTVQRIKNASIRALRIKIGQELVKLCFKLNLMQPINYMFSAGRKGCLELSLGFNIKGILKGIKMYPINSSDYNNYKYYIQDRLVEQDYIVFLDEYYPFHPDGDLLGGKRYPSDIYYNTLNRTLELVEKKFGLEVVIAAHPKALLYKDKNYFNGRKVFFNKTSSLVKFSKMAITHDSTSLSYAVMNKLPILLLSSVWMEKNRPDLVHSIESVSTRLALPILKMDSDIDEKLTMLSLNLNQTQLALYDNYIYDYCTSPDIKGPNEELVIEYMGQIFDSLNCDNG